MQQNRSGSSTTLSILILGAFFFIFGFVTWLNGVLIPYFKIACELQTGEVFWVASAFYISYFFMAFPSSWILKRTGLKKGMSVGLFVMAIGAAIFIPAALLRNYSLFLTGLFIIGTGLTVLQTASNPYVTIIGPIESAARRISIMGICNKAAATIGLIILGAIILSDADALTARLAAMNAAEKAVELDALARRVILPYSCMAGILVLLGLLIPFSPLPEIEMERTEDMPADNVATKTNVLQFPNLVLGVVALFLYVGVEVMAGDTIGIYGQSQGIALSQAKFFPSLTLIAMLVGYVAGIIAIPRYISQSKALVLCAVTGILFTVLAIVTHGYVSVMFIALLGLANALVWPAIWPLSLHGLGQYTKTASALLIMAIVGGATLPVIWGYLSDIPTIGHQQAYWIMVPCYLFIWYYATYGHKIKSWG